MRVIDHEPNTWFLLQDGDGLLLDGHYSNSFVGYAYPIRLSPEEADTYRRDGRDTIHRLVERIQYTVPISAASTSPYVGRRLDSETASRMHEAILAWKDEA